MRIRWKGEGEEGEEEEYPVWAIVTSLQLVPYRHVKFNIVNRHAPSEIPHQCCSSFGDVMLCC
jgi:hypothetical protein